MGKKKKKKYNLNIFQQFPALSCENMKKKKNNTFSFPLFLHRVFFRLSLNWVLQPPVSSPSLLALCRLPSPTDSVYP